MQIQNNLSFHNNNYSKCSKSNLNFTAIKSIKCQGLYKKAPEYGKELLEAFNKNPVAMDFCKKYDVSLIFYADKYMSNIKSSLVMFYENQSISKISRFIKKLFGSDNDVIHISSWNNNLKNSTAELVERILPEHAGRDKAQNGLLSSHIQLADEKMQQIINAKEAKKAAKLAKQAEKQIAVNKLQKDQNDLSKQMSDLIEATKKQ